ncbi:MAG: GTP cyclohydrolase I FolE2 [FCB group bacterium]|nr:GTP cyclohydrolase I FolE2 [FCB group bacterium]
MDDIQSSPDCRGIPIECVGITDLVYPITVLDRDNEKQDTIGTFSMSVNLPHHFKGTHMSRFVEVLNEYDNVFTGAMMPLVLASLMSKFEAESATIEVSFPYFITKHAPVTKTRGIMNYECTFKAESTLQGYDFILTTAVPVTSLCPCSREISSNGAHNQRGTIKIDVRFTDQKKIVWIEELVDIAEASASAPVYSLLKRPDEKHLTEIAYDNPVFVEDMVRNVTQQLKKDDRISWFRVEAKNQESIHNHNAFAVIEWKD